MLLNAAVIVVPAALGAVLLGVKHGLRSYYGDRNRATETAP